MENEMTVGDIYPFLYGKGLPKTARNELGEYPVYGSNGIIGKHDKPLTKGPTVIIGRKGTVGAVHLSKNPCWPIDTAFYVEFEEYSEARFAAYLLGSIGLESMNSDSAVPGLNRYSAHSKSIKKYSKIEKDTITQVLGSLDDKIELNRQMSKTLEETAKALFKSWFVDFDPVHAKAAGEAPFGLSSELAELFPDSFVDSELGKIPKGWTVSSVEDLITRLSIGMQYSKKTANLKGEIPIIDQSQKGFVGFHDNEPGVFASKDEPKIIFTDHTCYMRLVFYPFSAIQSVIPFVGRDVDSTWLYFATVGKQSIVEYKRHWADFVRHKISVPDKTLTIQYSRFIKPLLMKSWNCIEESWLLASLRDALLPSLISGDLKLEDAERIIARSL